METTRAMALALIGTFLLLATGTIKAQDIRYDDSAFQLKSEATAQRYSLFGTLIPVGMGLAMHDKTGAELALAGVVVGPSLGYFYGGKPGRGLTGIGIRIGIGAASVIVAKEAGEAAARSDPGFLSGLGEALSVLTVGSLIIVIHAIHDISTVKSTVEKHNNELIRRSQASVTLNPKYFVDSGAGGLQLTITF